MLQYVQQRQYKYGNSLNSRDHTNSSNDMNGTERMIRTMPSRRVTMQDIADACGLSRNTVSKVFNNRGAVPQETCDRVMQKARDLGYMSAPDLLPAMPVPEGNIALLTGELPGEGHFASLFLSAFTDQISRRGYSLKIYEVSAEELREKRLPPHFNTDRIAGIVGVEFFDQAYLDMVCGLGIPTVLIDCPAEADSELQQCDYVMMENITSTVSLVRGLAAAGAKHIGFVGDRMHCGSFRERWIGYSYGLRLCSLEEDPRLSICEPDSSPYDDPEWLFEKIGRMPFLPDAFVCANDYLAIHLMMALKKKGIAVPEKIMVTGFDGTAQSAFTNPPLTTVQVPGPEIGRLAADVLLGRIRNCATPYAWIRVRAVPVWRESAG